MQKPPVNAKKVNSRRSVRWSAVPDASRLGMWGRDGERGSGPEGTDDLYLVFYSQRC